jgi:hypothetical protein
MAMAVIPTEEVIVIGSPAATDRSFRQSDISSVAGITMGSAISLLFWFVIWMTLEFF